jgi:bacterioferritin-associated ferredoxin
MIVCLCHRVSDRDIASVARQGCASFDELQDELRVGTACGACSDCARETFAAHASCRRESEPVTWQALRAVLIGAPAASRQVEAA